jgi:hypothetical protein
MTLCSGVKRRLALLREIRPPERPQLTLVPEGEREQ